MAPSSFADMYDSSPAALARVRGYGGGDGGAGAGAGVVPATPPAASLTPDGRRGGDGDDVAASLGTAFAAMMTASPANLARMREMNTTPMGAAAAAAAGPTPYNTPAPGAAGANAPKPPTISFEAMFGASPADLAKMRSAQDAAGPAYHAPSPRVVPADPSRFDDMFAASPAQLAKMRSAADASTAAAASSPLINPERYADMFGASPAQLAKMRSARADAHPSSSSSSSSTSAHAHARASGHGAADRFTVVYDLESPDEAACREKILAICLEQTVELPASLVPEGTWIREHVVGRLERLTPGGGLNGSWRAEVSYHADTAGGEITQLINVIFGNTSMKEGVMVADVVMPPEILAEYPGPKFGVEGLRRLTNVPHG